MKKKNGFTLVELLVVIALMLSILGISVVSFITISNKKKEEAWKEVQNQIEVAAKQYFSSNEYLFEGLSDGSTGTISVGKLVEEDYLNVVTNPKTGKLISKCSVVNVTKNGNKYTASFNNNSENSTDKTCDTQNFVTVSEPGAPVGEIKYYKGNEITTASADEETKWFNIKSFEENGKLTDKKLKVCIQVIKSNGTITSAKIDNTEVSKDSDNGYCTIISEDVNKNYTFSLTNQSNKTWTNTVLIQKDTEYPEGKVELVSSNKDFNSIDYFDINVDVTIYLKDKTSGIDKVGVKGNMYNSSNFADSSNTQYQKQLIVNNIALAKSYDGGSYYIRVGISDKAGNGKYINSDNKTVYKECSQKKLKRTESGNYGECVGSCGGTGTKTKDDIEYYEDSYTYADCGSKLNKKTTSCQTKACSTTTTKTTTTSVCSGFANATESNIKDYVEISVEYVYNVTENGSISYYSDGSNYFGGTETKFKFKSKDSNIEIFEDITGGYLNAKKTGNNPEKNTLSSADYITKITYCDTNPDQASTPCKNGIKYAVSCAYVKCGSTAKKVCYRVNLTNCVNNKNCKGEYSYVGD